MRTFIRELWELWYWSVFSPLKLNQRLQEWVPASEVISGRRLPPSERDIKETRFCDIMWWAVQPSTKASRIRSQYVILVMLSTLPLGVACFALGGFRHLFLWLAITILSVAFGAVIPSLGLAMPWMSAWIYIRSPSLATVGILKIVNRLPPTNRIAASLAVIVAMLALVTWATKSLNRSFPKVATGTLAFGEAGAITAGMAVISPDEPFLVYLFGGMVLFGAWMSTGVQGEKDTNPEVSRIRRMPLGMGWALAFGLATALEAGPGDDTPEGAAIFAIFLIMLSSLLSFRVFMGATSPFCSDSLARNLGRSLVWGLACGFVLPILGRFFISWGRCPLVDCVCFAFFAGFAIAPSRVSVRPFQSTVALMRALVEKGWSGILNFADAVLRLEELFWLQVLLFAVAISVGLTSGKGYWAFLCLPAVLLGYSRILPDWPLLTLTNLLRLRRANAATPTEIVQWLDEMPPHAYDIALLPIPGQSRLFASLFRQSPSTSLEAILRACDLPLPLSWAYHRTELDAWRRIGFWVAKMPASDRSVLIRQRLMALHSIEHIAWFSTELFPVGIFLKDSYVDPEKSGQWASNGDIEQFVPLFKGIGAQVKTARAAGLLIEQERGLEGAVANLSAMRELVRELGVDVEQWLDVIDRWERRIRDSIEALGVPAHELLQPFQAGGALRPDRPHLFKGRRLLTEQVAREIAGPGRAPLILHGPRQCGKSSFLLHLSRLLSPGILPVYVDLQSQAITSSESEFCFRLISAAVRDLRGVCPRVQQLPKVDRAAFQSRPYPVFEDWLDSLLDSIEDAHLLICIDEFEKLGKAIERCHMSTAIFDELRHLSQHRDRLRFIFCGAQTFDELGPQWTHYFINSKPIEVRYLEPDEARELLLDPDPHFGLKYAPGVLDQIIGLTSCQPYLVQLVGEAMVKVARTHGTRVIDESLLDAAIKEALTAGEFYFASLWAETTGHNAEEIASGQTLLCAIAGERDMPPLEGPARAAMQRLQRYHVVTKKDGGYRIEIPLVARWVQERKVVDVLGETGASGA